MEKEKTKYTSQITFNYYNTEKGFGFEALTVGQKAESPFFPRFVNKGKTVVGIEVVQTGRGLSAVITFEDGSITYQSDVKQYSIVPSNEPNAR
jgi:hypothetical protein